jgi:hypothetical protein
MSRRIGRNLLEAFAPWHHEQEAKAMQLAEDEMPLLFGFAFCNGRGILSEQNGLIVLTPSRIIFSTSVPGRSPLKPHIIPVAEIRDVKYRIGNSLDRNPSTSGG